MPFEVTLVGPCGGALHEVLHVEPQLHLPLHLEDHELWHICGEMVSFRATNMKWINLLLRFCCMAQTKKIIPSSYHIIIVAEISGSSRGRAKELKSLNICKPHPCFFTLCNLA